MSRVQIGPHLVGPGQPTFVIAEVGINHNGMLVDALELVRAAHKAGAHAVKFQKRTVDVVYSPQERAVLRDVPRWFLESALKRGVVPSDEVSQLYAAGFCPSASTQDVDRHELIRISTGIQKLGLEFTSPEYLEISRVCRELGMLWFASPWDEGSVDFLERFDMPCYKVASASLTDDALLLRMRSTGKPIILSTGGSTMEQIHHAVEVLGRDNLVILHCTAAYPQTTTDDALEQLNLDVIWQFQVAFPEVPVGFSSNDPDRMPSIFAAAKGACVIEKHLTLDRRRHGSDQASSTEPHDFEFICEMIRLHDIARGDGVKTVYPAEIAVMKKLRKK